MNENNLVSKYLLNREIERHENHPELMKSNPMFYSMCKKELVLIEKIHTEMLDLSGSLEDVKDRFEGYSIFIESPEVMQELVRKAKWYDTVHKMMEEEK